MPASAAAQEVRRGTVLVIAMASSIHVVRWMRMVSACSGLRFILCPVFRAVPRLTSRGIAFLNPNFGPVRFVHDQETAGALLPGETGVFDLESVPQDEIAACSRATSFEPFHPAHLPPDWNFTEPGHVAAAIERLQPRLVISLEVQFAGYLALATKGLHGGCVSALAVVELGQRHLSAAGARPRRTWQSRACPYRVG